MLDKTNELIQIVEVYTTQIEKYETLSTWYSAFCIACVLMIIFMIILLILRPIKEDAKKGDNYNIALSVLFLLIPTVMTLYLYTFAMNMRKVALYRGYLNFLEKQWNMLTQSEMMIFDFRIIRDFYSPQSFWVNGLGPVVMAFFVVLFFLGGFGMAAHCAKNIKSRKLSMNIRTLLCVLFIVYLLFDGMCVYYLSTNDQVVESVNNYCTEYGEFAE